MEHRQLTRGEVCHEALSLAASPRNLPVVAFLLGRLPKCLLRALVAA